MRLLNKLLRLIAWHARERDVQSDVDPEAALGTRADPDTRGHRRVFRDFRPPLGGDELHRPEKAGRIAGREELLGVVARAAAAAQLLRRRQTNAERAVLGRGLAVTSAR